MADGRINPDSIYRPGVYKITNIITNQIYVGSAAGRLGIGARFNTHKNELRKNIHPNTKLQNSWNKYGESNFVFEVIEFCSKDLSLSREQYYLDTLKPYFNIRKNAKNNLGLVHSQETKEKISSKKKGQIISLETRKKISLAHKGIRKTPEHIEKVRLANLGKKRIPRNNEEIAKLGIGKSIISISWSSGLIQKYNSIREAARILNIPKSYIQLSLKNRYLVNKDIIFIFENNYCAQRNFKQYFYCYEFNSHYFLTLKDTANYLNKSETTIFRKIKKGEVLRHGR